MSVNFVTKQMMIFHFQFVLCYFITIPIVCKIDESALSSQINSSISQDYICAQVFMSILE